ncbi:enoyl-CoA hydratase/isomerase family protein [Teichococcus cervicalis]|uniref:Enoyl-CoA hydratase/isomerase family protein n=2 Tax=Teichococcus cervicalis TaxID=204525 RepID=D5RMR4_9PROT|nr:enoyl-CoA hydratase-related protein [Pseudoroseomonas cervicalis]EFH11405.1 enoyl-CoA hydratase/isomerase family protein [Pseudoroseomonas cervicalis ATCC 49957]
MADQAGQAPAMRLRQERDGAVLVLTLDQPARRNALSPPLRAEMAAVLDRAEGDATIRAIVVTGAGGTFCSGGDLSGMEVGSALQGRERLRPAHQMIRLLVAGSKPVVAAVEGWAAGAGLSLACACDSIVAAEDARFMAAFGKVGLMADLGLPFTLPQRVGPARARQILFYGEPIGAEEALRIGLADQLAPSGKALEAALARARILARQAPAAIALTKQILAEGLDRALEAERHYQSLLFLSADHAEGKAAFFGKREPGFTGT